MQRELLHGPDYPTKEGMHLQEVMIIHASMRWVELFRS